ncbi:MAG: cytidine deaminase [Elusimicrobiota bacterium]|jgi:cytidine deaminase|nr:cytidine deaminase [Elusimicrobiota bacterium]
MNAKDKLIKTAVAVMRNSYSPYSRYKVGAAAQGASGKIYAGTNVENASYGLTVCAERIAVFSAVAAGERGIKAIAIAVAPPRAAKAKADPVPCGACRQVLEEFSKPDMPIYTASVVNGKAVSVIARTLGDYYPYPFGPEALD